MPSDSKRVKVVLRPINACKGVLNNVKTMKRLNICREFPVIHIPNAFIGSCLAGAMATSQAFLSFKESISAGVGVFRAVLCACFDEALDPCK